MFHWKRSKTISEPTPYMIEVMNAAENGNPEAQHYLGKHYSEGQEGFEQNDQLAMKWLHAAAEQGFAPSMALLGGHYMFGNCCKRDDKLAFQWLHKYVNVASEDEPFFATAANYVGDALISGIDCEQSWMEGVFWLNKAASRGYTDAVATLGYIYLQEDGPYYRPEEAFQLFQRAAQEGSSKGQRGLGLCYLMGKGVQENLSTACDWLLLAANQGDQKARHALDQIFSYTRKAKRL